MVRIFITSMTSATPLPVGMVGGGGGSEAVKSQLTIPVWI